MKKLISYLIAVYFYVKTILRIWKALRNQKDDIVYTTKEDVKIGVYPGKKQTSSHDFIVKYREPNRRERTPAHVHLIVELYVKHAFNAALTLRLKEHILSMFASIQPINYFPPHLQYYKNEHSEPFKELDRVGEFTVEFILVVTEFLGIQEKTNYPRGSLTEKLYMDFGVKDRFSVIQKAVYKG